MADRIEEYHELGFDEFILSGHPHLEEAYWFGEGVMPILRRRGLLAPRSSLDRAHGPPVLGSATIANAPLESPARWTPWRLAALRASITPAGREPEVTAQGRRLVLGTQHPALLEQRDDRVDEPVEPGGGEVRCEDEAVGAVGLHEVVHLFGDL